MMGFFIICDFQSISSILLLAILDFVLFANQRMQYHANLRVDGILLILPKKMLTLMVPPCMNNSEICEICFVVVPQI